MTKNMITVGVASNAEMRPAMLVQVASQFVSNIYIDKGNKTVNAKSIMGMMTLTLATGDEITISAEGTDEEKAVSALSSYLLT